MSARKFRHNATPVPKEEQEQRWLLDWVWLNAAAHPELALFYHIPNEGKRSERQGYELKRQGMRPGFPDNCLPVPRGPYGALYIELKRTAGGRVSEDQKWWIDALNRAGNCAMVCKGWESAALAIRKYLALGVKK